MSWGCECWVGAQIGCFVSLGKVLRSTHVVEQFSLSTFTSIMAFDIDLILGSFWTFLGPTGLFLQLGKGSKTVLRSTHVVEQFSFSMFSSILTFEFDLILWMVFFCGAQMGKIWKLFCGLIVSWTTLIFYVFFFMSDFWFCPNFWVFWTFFLP